MIPDPASRVTSVTLIRFVLVLLRSRGFAATDRGGQGQKAAALQGVALCQQISSSSDEAIKAPLGLIDEADKAVALSHNLVNDPARDQRRAGARTSSAAPLLLHDNGRTDLDSVIQIDDVLIGQANAAR
jgi:mRNA-degrading endonuclease toxin of MazEF toxin-antitoxin module